MSQSITAAPALDLAAVAPRQRTLLELLACPRCLGHLRFDHAVVHLHRIAAADIVCDKCDDRVGVIDQFRPSFLERELEACPSGPKHEVTVAVPVDLEGPDIARIGVWTNIHLGLETRGEREWATLVVDQFGVGFVIRFHGHDWSGIAEVSVDGEVVERIDLYRLPHETCEVRISGLTPRSHELRIRAAGEKRPEAVAPCVIVSGIDRLVPLADASPPAESAINRGNGYPPRFTELVEAMPADGLALDCGGGDRRFGDARVYNLEYLRFELPDIYGDGHNLPFKTGSFDVIGNQAVLEHVPEPQRIVDELTRILKPGGTLYLEAAFMQPIHAVPSHFFNITPHGMDHLCRALERVDSGWGGGMTESVGWWCQICNAAQKIGQARYELLMSLLHDLDKQLTPEELKNFAFYVWFEGRKQP